MITKWIYNLEMQNGCEWTPKSKRNKTYGNPKCSLPLFFFLLFFLVSTNTTLLPSLSFPTQLSYSLLFLPRGTPQNPIKLFYFLFPGSCSLLSIFQPLHFSFTCPFIVSLSACLVRPRPTTDFRSYLDRMPKVASAGF